MSEYELLQQFRHERSEEAFAQLVRHYAGLVWEFSGHLNQKIYSRCRFGHALAAAISPLMMRRFFTFIVSVFSFRRTPTRKRHLLGMYFDESNQGGRRKSNRDRA